MNARSKEWRCLAIGLVFSLVSATHAQQATGLVVSAETRAAQVGQRASFDVKLVNADAQPVRAREDMPVTLLIVSPSGQTTTEEIAIKTGENVARYELPMTEAGVFEVRAKNRELLEGADLVQARAAQSGEPKVLPKAAATPVSTPQPSASIALASAILKEAAASPSPTPRALLGIAGGAARPPTSTRAPAQTPSGDVAIAAAAPRPENLVRSPAALDSAPSIANPLLRKLRLNLRYSPQRRFLANGKDLATIFALVRGEVPLQDTKLFLFNSDGSLSPRPLIIKKGEPVGEATLSSEQIGKVKLDYWWSDGWVEFEGEPGLAVEFAPPITKMKLKASPHDISLLDEAQLVVQLTDEHGTPFKTDTERTVSFSIDEGRGAFSEYRVTIPAGASEATSKFLPTQRGDAVVGVSSANLRDQATTIRVTWPTLLLGLAALGGLVGGALAWAVRKKNPILYIAGGLVTGPFLLCGLVFQLLPYVPLTRPVLLNPIGAIVVAVLGGWGGTEVFALFWKKILGKR